MSDKLIVSDSPPFKVHFNVEPIIHNGETVGADLEATVVILNGYVLDVGRGRTIDGYVRLRYGHPYTNVDKPVQWYPYGRTGYLKCKGGSLTEKVMEKVNAWATQAIVSYMADKNYRAVFNEAAMESAESALRYAKEKYEREVQKIEREHLNALDGALLQLSKLGM